MHGLAWHNILTTPSLYTLHVWQQRSLCSEIECADFEPSKPSVITACFMFRKIWIYFNKQNEKTFALLASIINAPYKMCKGTRTTNKCNIKQRKCHLMSTSQAQRWASTLANRSNDRHRSNITYLSLHPMPPPQGMGQRSKVFILPTSAQGSQSGPLWVCLRLW